MQLFSVTSTALAEIGWSQEIGLVVRFNGGKIWAYTADKSVFQEIMDSSSKGAAFDRLVKKANLAGTEITEEELDSIADDASGMNAAARKHKARNPIQFLGELLKTNRQTAYF